MDLAVSRLKDYPVDVPCDGFRIETFPNILDDQHGIAFNRRTVAAAAGADDHDSVPSV
jgi:hypothetical protein